MELLIVIGIIAALVSLIFPSLQRVKELTRQTLCAVNLRGLGEALHTYAMDNTGAMPVEELCGNPQTVLVGNLYDRYVSDRSMFYCPSAADIERLIALIQQRVEQASGVRLQTEVHIVGEAA